MSSSESSPAPSPSPPASPQASFHGPLSLDRLVLYFVAAKRSLVATQHVSRANELVTSSRAHIEESAVLNAKNAFARRGVDRQVETLQAIRDGIADVKVQATDEFQSTIEKLDVANDRLQITLAALRKVVVDSSLQRSRGGSSAADRAEHDVEASDPLSGAATQKTLYDFVDEANHESLVAALRSLIDSYNDAHADLDGCLGRFDASIAAVSDALQPTSSSEAADRLLIYDEPPQPISHLFRGMEEHAGEMAALLHSLVSHYDLCVSALKHTEGGGEAAREAMQAAGPEELSTKDATTVEGVEESLYRRTAAEPISDDERSEMMRVLENDAVEVEDVVVELKDRSAEMEALYAELSKRSGEARAGTKRLRRAVELLHSLKHSLPLHLDSAAQFRQSWSNTQASIQAQTKELAGLVGFYEQFLSGYKKLLREVKRRQAVEAQMWEVAEKAQRELGKLSEADRLAREEFVEEVGDFLPGDIWPGLGEGGLMWEIRPLNEATGWSGMESKRYDEN